MGAHRARIHDTVLEVTCRLAAPLLPLTAEVVWKGLTCGRPSTWPTGPTRSCCRGNATLVRGMERVRQVCSAALALRTTNRLRVRLPLRRLVVAADDAEDLRAFTDVIRDEVNVKEVELTTDVASWGTFEVTVTPVSPGRAWAPTSSACSGP